MPEKDVSNIAKMIFFYTFTLEDKNSSYWGGD